MSIEEIFKGVLFIFVLICTLFLYHHLIFKMANSATKKIWFSLGVFIIFSLLNTHSDKLRVITRNAEFLHNTSNTIQLFWWLSLSYMIIQLINYWAWNQYYLKKGITVSRILKDSVSLVIIIFTMAAIVHFVYNKSVFGIFTASGVVAIILGYSAQTLLSDIFAGLGLNSSKEFSEGDWIQVNQDIGKVTQINWRFIKLLTLEDNCLFYPNSIISKLPITNLSQPSPMHKINIECPLYDDTSPHRYKKILIDAAQQSLKVLDCPAPTASILSLNIKREGNHVYQLTYFTSEIDHSTANDDIFSIVWYSCRRQGIKISPYPMEPLNDLTVTTINKFLKQCQLFQMLDQKEISLLASQAICHHFGPPERILEQGKPNSSLYIIYSGSVDIYLTQHVPKPTHITTLNVNEYFGEMSLLTGETCSASIFAKEESLVIEINHDNMANIFSINPDLVEKITEIIVTRQQKNEEIKASFSHSKEIPTQTLMNKMIERVKAFFNII